MATTDKFLTLQIAKDIEKSKSWEGLSTPYDLALYILRMAVIDPSGISSLDPISYSPLEPVGSDRSKLWIKTEGVPGIGIPIGGRYQMIYQYPPNVPFLWVDASNAAPAYLNRLSQSDLENYGLTDPVIDTAYYVIFNP